MEKVYSNLEKVGGGIEELPDVNRVEEKLRILEEEQKKKDEEFALEHEKEREEMQKQIAALQAAFAAKVADLECLIALNEL